MKLFRPETARPRRAWRRTPRAAVVVVSLALAGSVLAMEPAQAATTFTVNSAADPGNGTCDVTECTLREAITASNASPGVDTIAFAIGSGPQTIQPETDLPVVFDQVTIDGTTQPGYSGTPLIELDGQASSTGSSTGLYLAGSNNFVTGLAINRFSFQQVLIGESSFNTITNSRLGTNRAGDAVLAGGSYPLRIASRNAGPATNNLVASNVIAGGQTAVQIEASGGGTASDNTLFQNRIGIGTDGSALSGVGDGVNISSTGGVATGNVLQENLIANNGGQGIDLGSDGVTANDPGDQDQGANNLQNFPVLTQAVEGTSGAVASGTLNSTPSRTFRLELFSNAACDPSGNGEGETFVGSQQVTTDGSGDATFTTAPLTTVPAGAQVTATATDQSTGDTSEFSACRTVTAGTTTSPPGPPTGVTAAAGDAQAEVRWLAPGSDGGSPLTTYTVTASPSAGPPVTVPASATSVTVTGLTNGTPYTFTVTATNSDGLSSAASAPSDSVTPKQGAAPPETATAQAPAGGSLSTGDATTTSAQNPTNTNVQTPNGGLVSIAEGAMTNPPGDTHAYFGQQIDITAPDAAADNPLTFTFYTDCSVLPAGVSSCTGVPAARGTALAAAAATDLPTTASVVVKDLSYTPRVATIGPGGTVSWSFQGRRPHTVTDKLGLGAGGAPLFNSGLRGTGTSFASAFPVAGGYTYRSTASGDPTTMNGTVKVPVSVSAPTGSRGDTTTVTWASTLPAGYRSDVQYRYQAPGGSYGTWTGWRPNSVLVKDQFTLDRAGSFQFRSRLENSRTLKASLWAPPTTVSVSAPTGPPRLGSVAMFHETGTGNVQVPDCTGADRFVQPLPACTWSEEILPGGDLKTVVYTTGNGRWRNG